MLWNTSSCIANTILVTSGQTFSVSANSESVYRLVYDDWKNYQKLKDEDDYPKYKPFFFWKTNQRL